MSSVNVFAYIDKEDKSSTLYLFNEGNFLIHAGGATYRLFGYTLTKEYQSMLSMTQVPVSLHFDEDDFVLIDSDAYFGSIESLLTYRYPKKNESDDE